MIRKYCCISAFIALLNATVLNPANADLRLSSSAVLNAQLASSVTAGSLTDSNPALMHEFGFADIHVFPGEIGAYRPANHSLQNKLQRFHLSLQQWQADPSSANLLHLNQSQAKLSSQTYTRAYAASTGLLLPRINILPVGFFVNMKYVQQIGIKQFHQADYASPSSFDSGSYVQQHLLRQTEVGLMYSKVLFLEPSSKKMFSIGLRPKMQATRLDYHAARIENSSAIAPAWKVYDRGMVNADFGSFVQLSPIVAIGLQVKDIREHRIRLGDDILYMKPRLELGTRLQLRRLLCNFQYSNQNSIVNRNEDNTIEISTSYQVLTQSRLSLGIRKSEQEHSVHFGGLYRNDWLTLSYGGFLFRGELGHSLGLSIYL